MAFLPNGISIESDEFTPALMAAFKNSLIAFGVAAVGFICFLWIFPSKFVMNRLGNAAEVTGTSEEESDEPSLIGEHGTATCDLRPNGQVLIAGRMHSARSHTGHLIPEQSEIEVVAFTLGELVVKPLSTPDTKTAPSKEISEEKNQEPNQESAS